MTVGERLVDVSFADGGLDPDEIIETDDWLGIDDATSKEVAIVYVFENLGDKAWFIREHPDLEISKNGNEGVRNPNQGGLFDSFVSDPTRAKWYIDAVNRKERSTPPELATWRELGLPAFEPAGKRIILRVVFDSVEERDAYAAADNLQIAKMTRGVLSSWWPPRVREDLVSLRFDLRPAERLVGGLGTPRYPVYIPSKGRYQFNRARTARALIRDNVPFYVVVEPQEAEAYSKRLGEDRVLVLPFSNLGLGSIPARNWLGDHARENGYDRYWCIDDNILEWRRLWKGRRIPCHAGVALRVCEDLTDSFENIAISGLNYQMFVPSETPVPYYQNVHVYSAILLNSDVPFRWRGRLNEDTDICLQALDAGYCTLLVNAVMANKLRTMVMGGGNSDELYKDDGRLAMARSLEAAWPGIVSTRWKFGRPQHSVRWDRFDQPLKLRGLETRTEPDERGLVLQAVGDVQSPTLQRLLEEWNGAP